ncbi:hypothetical protein C8R45DRAFT_145080 [Mycena sanguinolenta]|nr:hypothetical protein C8R45DRAFT_145080 [Mycena sanguinolenta]
MAHPLFWPGKRYFYAIGNTAAVSLARDVPPDKDISLLLLGCGDPRNVLFTLFSEHDTANRKLDFTCVDFEPAVLARNVLLLSLIIDKKPVENLFDIFFHLYLEKDSLALLVSQCQALLGASITLQHWKESSYGSTLPMSSQHTLTELCSHWDQYARMHSLPKSQLDAIVADFKGGVAEYRRKHQGHLMMHTSRSAGPLMMRAFPVLSECFHDYWKHGTTSVSASSRSAATLLNPTFVYSQDGVGCHVHYGTDPVIPFHLAPVFGNLNAAPSRSDIVKAIRAQFLDWCEAFRRYHERSLCVVRIFFADAIFGARALQICRESGAVQTGIPVCQWRAKTITLDKEEYKHAPFTFDVVDTSNLDDHLGLLNVLATSIPLLSGSGDGVLYLESLLIQNSDGDAPKDFAKRFCADLTVMTVLFHLCPVDFIAGYSSRGNVHELLSYKVVGQLQKATAQQYHQVTTWKTPSGDPPEFEPQHLGTFLYDLYHALFEEEDASTFYERNRVNTLGAISRTSISHYSRESFVLLLKFIRDRLQISREHWIAVLDRFMDIQQSHLSPVKVNALKFQDFCGLLHLHGVYTRDTYRRDNMARTGPFTTWSRVPPLVRVFLTVPREKLRVLVESSLATPTLEAGMRGPRMQNIFSSIHTAFGIISAIGTPANPKAYFEEDPEGFQGNKPLIVSFIMPSMLLMDHGPAHDFPRDMLITFGIQSNAANVMLYEKTLGFRLEIHSARLFDQGSVLIIPEQPPPSGLSVSMKVPSASGPIGSQGPIGANFSEECDLLESFSTKINVEDELAKSAFQSFGNVNVRQISFGVIQLVLGGRKQDVIFPFPVAGAQHRLRLARKSLWIEIIVPLRISFTQEGANIDPFPVTVPGLMPWSIHRLNLERLPILNLKTHKLYEWLDPHVGAAFSRREAKARKKQDADALMFVKDSIHSIIVRSSGIQPKGSSPQRVFALRDKATNNCDTILFIDKLRFDLSAHTVVCDGFALPLSEERMTKIRHDFGKLVSNVMNIALQPGEITSWKQLLPVLVERCRTWAHLDSCQYISEGLVPLTTEMDVIPLCACGEGRDTQRMHNEPLWKPLAKYCTRIALSPLFGVSYLEPIWRTDRRCCVCRVKAGLTCPKCKKDRYCGQACQKKDWKRHKAMHHDIWEK